MAFGAKDWIARTDVYLQTLAELMIRIKYGSAKVASYSGTPAANTTTALFTISGKGIIYGGSAKIESTASQGNDNLGVILDGESLNDWLLTWENTFNIHMYHGAVPLLQCYDEVNFKYGWSIPMGLTFESSFVGFYIERHGRTPTVRVDIVYALV